jgi:hypothetical protein
MKQFTMELIKKPGKKLHPDLTWRRKREMRTEAKSGQRYGTKKQNNTCMEQCSCTNDQAYFAMGDNAENLHFPDPAISYLKRLVDNSMISDTANLTNLCSAQKDPHKLIDATKSEIEQFIGMLFFMSIYGLPHTEMYLSPLQLDIEVMKKPIAAPVPVHKIRTDKTGHWPTFTKKRGRCKKPNCVGIPEVICTKYKVHLCFSPSSNCFMEFHK